MDFGGGGDDGIGEFSLMLPPELDGGFFNGRCNGYLLFGEYQLIGGKTPRFRLFKQTVQRGFRQLLLA